MGSIEKLKKRLLADPKDFTYAEKPAVYCGSLALRKVPKEKPPVHG